MNHNSSVKTKNLKPFKKGDDPRRAKNGAACIERIAWTNLFLNRLAERLDPRMAANILATAYEAKRPWAITEVHERLMGKVTQPVGFQGEDGTTGNVLFVKVVQVKDGNGNGNTGK